MKEKSLQKNYLGLAEEYDRPERKDGFFVVV
jgi:hypothetical protein